VLRSALEPAPPGALSSTIGARIAAGFAAQPVAQRRQQVIRTAADFIGAPYLWGGRSVPLREFPSKIAGVDCSGLVNLAFRATALNIPRDAHEQWMRAKKIDQPEPADLIFLSEQNHPAKIVHVMLYAGEGGLIEAPGTGLMVRRIEAAKRLGRPLSEVKSGDVIDGQTISFGSYLAQ
jgi:cell wall-associated NlpC family hydrolase